MTNTNRPALWIEQKGPSEFYVVADGYADRFETRAAAEREIRNIRREWSAQEGCS